ncbi:hypothetical protein SSRP02_p024 [Synechococcus phage S-SRP02]|nr:hypothetical protein SSRP02_p024 [Synechococcus phage S-SRP02]
MEDTPVLALTLLAQLYGPACGWNYGVVITPENSPFLGCTVPNANGNVRIRLRMDPFTPGGVRAEPAAPEPYPPFSTPSGF